MTETSAVLDRNDYLHKALHELSYALSDGHKALSNHGFKNFAEAYRAGLTDPKQTEKSDFPSLIALQLTAVMAFNGRNGDDRNLLGELTSRIDEMVSMTVLEAVPALKIVANAFEQESHELDSVMASLLKMRDERAADIRKQTTSKFDGVFGDFASRRATTFSKDFFQNLEPSDVVDAIAQSASRYLTAAGEASADDEKRFRQSAEKLVMAAREMGGSNNPQTMKLLSDVQRSLEDKAIKTLVA